MQDLTEVLDKAARAVGAIYVRLVLWDGPTEEPYLVLSQGVAVGDSQTVVALAQRSVSQAQPMALLSERDAREMSGGSLDGRMLPILCVPFPSSDWSPQGALIASLPHEDTEGLPHRLQILEYMAEWVGALLANRVLREEIQHKEEQVRDLMRATLDAQEAERERICLEVHDGVTQTLASAFQYLQTLESAIGEGAPARHLVLSATRLIRQAMQESREVINSLQPATLRDLGLVATLRQETRELEAELKWRVDFKADPVRLTKDVETGLYRIVQEAITNAKKHSGTDSLRVRLAESEGHLLLEVRDWGRGFDLKRWTSGSHSKETGLLSMRRRAELLQGSFTLESSPGQGTTVRVEIPSAGWEKRP